jgi:hypothetical protein
VLAFVYTAGRAFLFPVATLHDSGTQHFPATRKLTMHVPTSQSSLNTMASIPLVLPSARIYVGPGDKLFGYDRIWVVLWAGRCMSGSVDAWAPRHHQRIQGRHGEESKDLKLLSDVLKLPDCLCLIANSLVSLSSHAQRRHT